MTDDLDKFLNIPRASGRQQSIRPPTLWYGLCGMWTDDWSKLNDTKGDGTGIPCCPGCGAVGFVEDVQTWWLNVDAYEAGGTDGRNPHPGYRKEVEASRGICPVAAGQ